MGFLAKKNAAKPKSAQEFLTHDAISLNSVGENGPFLESALDLLSTQRPVWEPSREELLEFNQQKTVLSMMAAIREGDRSGMISTQLPISTQQQLAAQNQIMQQNDVLRQAVDISVVDDNNSTKISYQADSEFVNLDVLGIDESDQRVTLGVSSRAIFAKSGTAAKLFQLPVACLVACITNNTLNIVFHCSSDGSKSVNVDLEDVMSNRLGEEHLKMLSQQFYVHEAQARLFASAIALQAIGYNESITAGMVRSISDQYNIDYEGLLRFAISIEKWRVTENPASFF